MNKIKSISILMGVTLMASSSAYAAENNEATLLAKTLSEMYGAAVNVEITDDNCKVTYPEVKIEDEVIKYTKPEKPGEEPKAETKTVTTVIPATEAKCSKIQDFNGKSQYLITNSSPDKLIAQVYNLLSLSFVKELDIKNFKEETAIVPEFGMISSDKLHITDASYTQKDETTGLKSELGNLNDLTVKEAVTQVDDIVKYRADMNMNSLNIAHPIASAQIKVAQQAAEIEYKLPSENKFDYSNVVQNFEYLKSSKSRFAANGIKVDIGMLDFSLAFDLDTNNFAEFKEDDKLYSNGSFVIKNLAFTSNMIDKARQLKSMALKYDISDVTRDSFVKLSKLQQQKSEEQIDDAELAKILDDMFETAKFNSNMKLAFPNSEIDGKFSLARKNGYIDGVGKISVKNLFALFPDKKKCFNPQTKNDPECAQDMMLAGLAKYIDITKNNSETIIKYNEKGIFKGNEKIGDPIELNFQKMYQEKQARKKQQEEMMKQYMEQQKNQ